MEVGVSKASSMSRMGHLQDLLRETVRLESACLEIGKIDKRFEVSRVGVFGIDQESMPRTICSISRYSAALCNHSAPLVPAHNARRFLITTLHARHCEAIRVVRKV